MKTLMILLLSLSFSCTEENASQNNNSWDFNNKKSNNETTSNNGTTSNNNGTTNNTNNGTTGGTTGTTSSVRVPVEHRSVAAACDDVRPKGSGGDPSFRGCLVDEDCNEGANGRCNFDRRGSRCSYDTCFSDSDCGTNVCACESPDVSHIGNKCLIGNCQVDADCGTDGFCSPTFGSCGNYNGDIAYFCHTPEDECIDDSDCSDKDGVGTPYCKFSNEVNHWVCDDSQCVG